MPDPQALVPVPVTFITVNGVRVPTGGAYDTVQALGLGDPASYLPGGANFQGPIAENTPLPPVEEQQFQQWARANRIPDVDQPDSRYDYRGFWLQTGGAPHPPGSEQHFPDTYKQHGHPTFSQESQYSRGPDDGGFWLGEQFQPQGSDTYQPGGPRFQGPLELPLEPDQNVPADKPDVPGVLGASERLLGAITNMLKSPFGAGVGALVDRPGDLGHASRAAWEDLKQRMAAFPQAVFQPTDQQGGTSVRQEAEKRGLQMGPVTGEFVDLMTDPTNVIGGNPILDTAKLAVGGAGLLKSGAMMGMALSPAMIEKITERFPRFAKALEEAGHAIPAYHGSPHQFERFDVSKIGTGEGAQAYGHGLYFAENPAVARDYRDRLSKADLHVEYAGRTFPPHGQGLSADQRQMLVNVDTYGKDEALRGARAWAQFLRDGAANNPTAKYQIADQERLIDWLEQVDPAKVRVRDPGAVYEVALRANPAHFLDWDKPLSEHAPEVLDKVRTVIDGRYGAGTLDTLVANGADPRDLIGNFDDLRHGQMEQLLHEAGVPGIKYLDQGSRDAKAGTRNYVMFGDDRIRILNTSGAPVDAQTGHLPFAPAQRTERGKMVVSTRVPTSVERAPAPDRSPLITDLSVVKQSPVVEQKMADRLATYPVLTEAEAKGTPAEVLERFTERVKQNLLWLWDQTPDHIRQLSKQWYEGAHARSLEDAKALRVTPEQSSAVIAILSPQKDWFQNAELARRLGSTWREFTDTNPAFTSDLFDQYRAQIFAGKKDAFAKLTPKARRAATRAIEDKLVEERALYEGKAFVDLPAPGKARMIRAFSEGTHATEYPMLLPTGEVGGVVKNADGKPAKLGWGLPNKFIENAISVLEDGRWANISEKLGEEHKVRSFFNNINDPAHAHSVTIDTHAVAAALLSPMSQVAPEVNYVMGGVADSKLGISGANAVYAEAYKRAAAERGVLPREMQSVTWESLRGLFSPAQKRDKALVAEVRALWDQHRAGKLPLTEVYEHIRTAAGGITEPAWVSHYRTPAR